MEKQRLNLENEMIDIIEGSNLEVNAKNILKKVFLNLTSYEVNTLDKIEEQVNERQYASKENLRWNQLWNIKTTLKQDNELKIALLNNFYEYDKEKSSSKIITDMGERECHQIFLNCSYDEIKSICKNEYKGQYKSQDGATVEFCYKFVPHYRFVDQEEILFKTASLYKIYRPVILSPYARKAVDICIESEKNIDLNEGEFDFCWGENQLIQKVLLDYNLLWNVNISYENETFPYGGEQAPEEAVIHYPYYYRDGIDNNTFIYPSYENCLDDIEDIIKNEEEIKIIYDRKLLECELSYYRINITDVEEEQNIFNNNFNLERLNKIERIRTKSDIEYILSQLNYAHDFKVKFLCIANTKTKVNNKIITRYSRQHSYFKDKNEQYYQNINEKYKKICYLEFSGEEKFLTDYANYILAYMEQFYPEFNWAGVY